MKRTRAPEEEPQQQLPQQQPSPPDNTINATDENKEGVLKKPRIDFAERISRITAALERHIDEHERSRIEAQEKIEKAYNALKEAADDLEKYLNDKLQERYAKEEARLQESVHKLNTLSEKNDARKMDGNDMSNDEDIEKEMKEVEKTLYGAQRYEVKVPECNDLKEWASGILDSEFKVDVSKSLSGDLLKGRTPRITEVEEVNPNEVHIDIDFLGNAMDEIGYVVEIWNGEEGEDYEVRSEQVLGPSHNAYIEWRFRGGSVCKIRGRVIWRGTSGKEEYLGEWGEWTTFAIPREHKNDGLFFTGPVWDKKERDVIYTVSDIYTGNVIYKGKKRYTLIPESSQEHPILVQVHKKLGLWEETEVERAVVYPKDLEYSSCFDDDDLINDLRIFHTDRNICLRVLEEIKSLLQGKIQVKNNHQHA